MNYLLVVMGWLLVGASTTARGSSPAMNRTAARAIDARMCRLLNLTTLTAAALSGLNPS